MTPLSFTPGRNCWRVDPADRFSLIVDGQAYFRTLRQALLGEMLCPVPRHHMADLMRQHGGKLGLHDLAPAARRLSAPGGGATRRPFSWGNAMRFSANLGFLWADLPLPQAIRAAAAAGFCDQPHLTRLLKRATGLTPARMRLA